MFYPLRSVSFVFEKTDESQLYRTSEGSKLQVDEVKKDLDNF